eukprot:gene3470-3967_t
MKRNHHSQAPFCHSRPKYREARWNRAVKVYTINQESKYLLINGIPSIGVGKEAVELFAIYGEVEEYKMLDEYPSDEFTDTYWIKFKKVQSARFAKKKLDMRSFYGGILHITYAPEFETIHETKQKLQERRHQVKRKCTEKPSVVKSNELKANAPSSSLVGTGWLPTNRHAELLTPQVGSQVFLQRECREEEKTLVSSVNIELKTRRNEREYHKDSRWTPSFTQNSNVKDIPKQNEITWIKQTPFIPEAREPFVEESRQSLSMQTGDKNLDDVAQRIRDKLKKISTANYSDSEAKKARPRKRI